MGLKDFFSSSGRAESRLARLSKTVINQYSASPDRYGAMQQLFELAKKDPDLAERAHVALLKRFTISSSKSIEDEEEKGWVFRELSQVGKPLLPALRKFAEQNENIAWALRLLEDIANESEEWECLEALIERHPPDGFERAPDKKLQLLTHVQDIDDPRVAEILARYLNDRDESVRFFAVEALIDIADESSLAPLIARLSHPEEDSLRLKTRILDGLSSLEWDVTAERAKMTAHLGAEHEIRDNKVTRR